MNSLNQIILDNLGDVVFYIEIVKGRYKFASVNKAFLSVTGLKSEQVVGKFIDEVIPHPSIDIVQANYDMAIREKRTVKWREITEFPTGLKHGDCSIIPVFDDNGICNSLVGTVHDVTPIIEADLALERTMERISDGIVSFDKDFTYTFVNKRAGELLRRRPEDLLGVRYLDQYPEAIDTIFYKAYRQAFVTQLPVYIKEKYPFWDRWFENRIFPSESGITIFFNDVTDQILREEELSKAKNEAVEALKVKTQFLDMAAHELRNPVASISLTLQAMKLQKQKGISPSETAFSDLVEQSDKLNQLVRDLLDPSKHGQNLVSYEYRIKK